MTDNASAETWAEKQEEARADMERRGHRVGGPWVALPSYDSHRYYNYSDPHRFAYFRVARCWACGRTVEMQHWVGWEDVLPDLPWGEWEIRDNAGECPAGRAGA